jgi:methanogenic corrinoid protein MtbC1
MSHLDAALADIDAPAVMPPSFVDPAAANGDLARCYLDRLLDGDRNSAADLAERSVQDGLPLQNLYLDVFQPAMREIGRLWQLNRITVAQEHFCTAATQAIMNGFVRRILQTPRNGLTVTAACLGGEFHEVGLRMVADLLELDGWNCSYVGGSVPVSDMIESLADKPPDLVAVSVTMTENVGAVVTFIDQLRRTPGLQRVPVLVGGRPFAISATLSTSVGADGCALDAATALSEARRLAGLPSTDTPNS